MSLQQLFEELRLSNSVANRNPKDSDPGGPNSDNWLGRRDSNPDTQIQSLQSYR
jgi:hypothetical protein